MKSLNKDLAVIQLNQVIEQLEEYDTEAMVNIYNQYADAMRYERINDNDEHIINDLYSSPYDALLAASYGDYNPNHDYFTFDGYNNLSSFNFTDDDNCPIDIGEIAEWINNNELYNDFDITVVTLDDKYNIVLDHINDIDSVSSIQSLLSYLAVEFIYTNEWLSLSENNTIDNYIEKYINAIIVHFIDNTDNDQLDGLLDYFNVEL